MGLLVRAVDFRRSLAQALTVDNKGSRNLLSELLGSETDGALKPDVIEVPDSRTLITHLNRASPDFHVLMSVLNPAVAVPDGQEVPATGPYEIGGRRSEGVSLTRNREWDANLDPPRTAYPDRFEIDESEARSRILNARPGEAITSPGITFPRNELSGAADPSRLSDTVPASRVESYVINTARVSDLAARRAIATALPAQDVLRARGRHGHASPAATRAAREPCVRSSRGRCQRGSGKASWNSETGRAEGISHHARCDRCRAG
ncbi:ABC transporter substrate-binding protein [Streptomyces buecherae]|uniref:ABC transporter substrate-binding protein n=1 Tax=Streptomyces buecherae TaxID=2763006 RepID=UPI00368FC9A7